LTAKALALLVIGGACLAQTVSNVRIADNSLSGTAVTLVYDVSGGSFTQYRTRFVASPTSCTGGTGGTLTYAQTNTNTGQYVNRRDIIAGLAASTTYNMCPEVFGASWSSGGPSISVTTPAMGSSAPLPPTAVNTTFPAPNGTTYTIPAGDCDNATTGFMARLNTATTHLAAGTGDTIVIPAGTFCPGPYTFPYTATAKTFRSTAVTTSTSNIALTAHGFSENQEVRVGLDRDLSGACLPGTLLFDRGQNRCDYSIVGGWRNNHRYKVHVVNANNIQLLEMDGTTAVPGYVPITADAAADTVTFQTPDRMAPLRAFGSSADIDANYVFQFVNVGGALPGGISADTDYYTKTACTSTEVTRCTTQLSTTPGGAAVNITSAGSGVTYLADKGSAGIDFMIAPAPDPSGQYITIKSGGNLPPAGNRLTPDWDSQLGGFQRATPYDQITNNYSPIVLIPAMVFNIHFQGVLFTVVQNTDYQTSLDPRSGGNVATEHTGSENIIYDQTHWRCFAYPQRCGGQAKVFNFLDGRNVAIINSTADNIDYWQNYTTGYTPSVSAGTGILAAGTASTGASYFGAKTASGNSTLTITSGSAGTVYVYFSMAGVLTAGFPSGMTGSWACSAGITCGTAANITGFPVVTLGSDTSRIASCPIATFTVSGGAVTAAASQTNLCTLSRTSPLTEGATGFISGIGPGPFLLDNNFIGGSGIPYHYDDSAIWDKASYTITRNMFYSNPSYCIDYPTSNGLRYWNRNSLEWKGGQYIDVNGNIFQGSCAEVSNASTSVAITPRNNSSIASDFNFRNNWFRNAAGGVNICGPQQSPILGWPCIRQAFTNNLFTLNGANRSSPGNGASAHGWAMSQGQYSGQITFSHNTTWNPTGVAPTFTFWDASPAGGVSMTDNLVFVNGGADGFGVPGEFIKIGNLTGCLGGDQGYSAAQCTWLNGPGVAGYTFTGNALLPGYTTANTATPSGDMDRSTACGRWNGTWNGTTCGGSFIGAYFFDDTTTAARMAAAKYTDPANWDFSLDPTSPLKGAGSGGSDIGADFSAVLNANGIVRSITRTPSSTSVAMTYTAPDAKPCYLGYGTSSDRTTWTWASDGLSSVGARSKTFTGLSPSTLYHTDLICNAPQTAAYSYTASQITAADITTAAGTGATHSNIKSSKTVVNTTKVRMN
jgi:hypothetical protein